MLGGKGCPPSVGNDHRSRNLLRVLPIGSCTSDARGRYWWPRLTPSRSCRLSNTLPTVTSTSFAFGVQRFHILPSQNGCILLLDECRDGMLRGQVLGWLQRNGGLPKSASPRRDRGVILCNSRGNTRLVIFFRFYSRLLSLIRNFTKDLIYAQEAEAPRNPRYFIITVLLCL